MTTWKKTLSIPIPPANNELYRHVQGRTYLSHAGKAYRNEVHSTMIDHNIKPTSGEYEVNIEWHRERKAGDVDGRFKVLLDGMQAKHASFQKCHCKEKYGFYHDDKQVKKLTIERFDKKKSPQMIVKVREM